MSRKTGPVPSLATLDFMLAAFVLGGLIYLALPVFGIMPTMENSERPVPYWVWIAMYGALLVATPFAAAGLVSYLGRARDATDAAFRATVVVATGLAVPEGAALIAMAGYLMARVPDRQLLTMQILAAVVLIIAAMAIRTAVRNQLSRHGIRPE